ncbi:hypothetical protein C9374_000950 [Naegleria lovaniensis]|uniref:Protein FAM184A/B N-terminal domain-containing protein n=1 Tax=Naegleria lovaniensis TaxID=51637 RepID=A0AA88GSJ5_NAELO|nr:uncharacterized protein C9374_000950 [Naegleria lovaniensis]KAG2388100.1 hypothetical protein C9374_000950 [Naegleria lovaniensis]
MKSSKNSTGAVNNVSANKIANGFPDFHHKMSKKIAQLTKVIYHLNTKNDDHEFQLNSLADAYESEIEDIIRDTTAKLAMFREQIEKKNNDTKITDIVKTLTSKHNQERQKAMDEFEEFKRKAKEREEILKREYEEKVKDLTRTLQNVKEEFNQRLVRFTTLTDELEKNKNKGDADMRLQHNKEVEELVHTYNKSIMIC